MRLVRTSLVAAALAGCLPAKPQPVYSERRAALVPHPAPPLVTGATPRGGAIAVGASTLAAAREPREGDDTVGTHVPTTQLRGEVRGGNGTLDLGAIVLYGLAGGATSVTDDQPTPDRGGVTGAGIGFGGSHPGPGGLSLAARAELMLYGIPFVEHRTCTANCPLEDRSTEVTQDREIVPGLSLSIVQGYTRGRLGLFGGVSVQSHPVIDRGDIDVGSGDEDEEPRPGPFVAVVSAGMTLELAAGVTLAVVVYQPFLAQVVDYGPTLGAFVTVPLRRDPEDPAARPD